MYEPKNYLEVFLRHNDWIILLTIFVELYLIQINDWKPIIQDQIVLCYYDNPQGKKTKLEKKRIFPQTAQILGLNVR